MVHVPRQHFDKTLFLLFGLLTAIVVGLTAFVLGYCRLNGHYLVFVTPAWVMLPVLGLIYVTIVVGKCRNPIIAGGFALLMTFTAYWGQFPAALAQLEGPKALLSPSAVVSFAKWRIANEVMVPSSATQDSVARSKNRPEPMVNWAVECLAFFLITVGCTSLAAWRSGWHFCTQCDRWTSRQRLEIPWMSGGKVLEMYDSGTLEQFDMSTLGPFDGNALKGFMTVEFCNSRDVASTLCPVLLTLIDGGTWRPPKREQGEDQNSNRKVVPMPTGRLLDRVPLSESQTAALSKTFVKLRELVPTPS